MINNNKELLLNIIWNKIHEITKEISIIANNLSKTEISKEERDYLKNYISKCAIQLNLYLKMVDISIKDSNENNNFQNEWDQILLNQISNEKSEYYIGCAPASNICTRLLLYNHIQEYVASISVQLFMDSNCHHQLSLQLSVKNALFLVQWFTLY
ncbi:hypothetical protein ACTA71_009692 [Dictyostelium dimigraforme]